jgi:hypothetical protein
MDEARRVWMGSLEITELIRRHLQQEITSAAAPSGAPQPLGAAKRPQPALKVGGVSSPLGEEAIAPGAEKAFWFTVNAELVVYGATESDATVTVGGRRIRLRPDGTFSYRFALPDGEYPLVITAHSGKSEETRSTRLQFSRATKHHGAVGVHPQDPKLKTPADRDLA